MDKIKFFIMDVDGTLTDGKIYMGQNGELFKAFNIKDGYGIHDILPNAGIIPIIITARESLIVYNRCQELGVSELYQGCRDKLKTMLDILQKFSQTDAVEYDLHNVAYIGDDILDLRCIEIIKANGGITACPADAVADVKSTVDYVCSKNAGCGAVREFIEYCVQ